jgi:hypothetical protein
MGPIGDYDLYVIVWMREQSLTIYYSTMYITLIWLRGEAFSSSGELIESFFRKHSLIVPFAYFFSISFSCPIVPKKPNRSTSPGNPVCPLQNERRPPNGPTARTVSIKAPYRHPTATAVSTKAPYRHPRASLSLFRPQPRRPTSPNSPKTAQASADLPTVAPPGGPYKRACGRGKRAERRPEASGSHLPAWTNLPADLDIPLTR